MTKVTKVQKFGLWLTKRGVLLFGLFLLFMNLLAFLAPVLAHFGFEKIAHGIYFVYGFFCHQRPWRSLHLFDYQVAWCSRDTFIYLSMAIAAFIVYKFDIRKVKWWVPVICIFPFAIDGTTQLIAEIKAIYDEQLVFFYASTNFFRMFTGSIFGAGAGLWLFAVLQETLQEEFIYRINSTKQVIKEKSKYFNLKAFALVMTLSFLSYLILVQLWRITSPTYKPYGLIDNVRYFPGVNYEKTDRRGHAV